MIGAILLKNTENGSYRYETITIYNGRFYTEMQIDKPYISYTIDTVKRKIAHKQCSELKNLPYVRLSELYYILDESRIYFSSNPEATQLLFKYDGSSIEFKINSIIEGISSIPDYNNLLSGCGTYLLCGYLNDDLPKLNPLIGSILCDLGNFAICRIFGISNKIYYFSGCSIYVDLDIMFNSAYSKLALKKYLSKSGKLFKTICKVRKNCKPKETLGSFSFLISKPQHINFERCLIAEIDSEMINAYRHTFILIYEKILEKIKSNIFNSSVTDILINLFNDMDLYNIALNCSDEFIKFANKLEAYGYADENCKFNYVKADEILQLLFDVKTREKITEIAKGRARNYRLISNLPNPLLIDCMGQAYYD